MATTTLAATLNTPLSELRPATMDRILVIADDSALRKACTRTVDNHILRLRQKLESDPSHPSHLLTVHGMGYKFVP